MILFIFNEFTPFSSDYELRTAKRCLKNFKYTTNLSLEKMNAVKSKIASKPSLDK